jgi:uncharacterized protein with HEPN domain
MRKDPGIRPVKYLEYIEEACLNACEYIKGMSKSDFLNDKKTIAAVTSSFDTIGKACHDLIKYHAPFIDYRPVTYWFARKMCELFPTEHSYTTDPDILWNIVRNNLPELSSDASRVLVAATVSEQ